MLQCSLGAFHVRHCIPVFFLFTLNRTFSLSKLLFARWKMGAKSSRSWISTRRLSLSLSAVHAIDTANAGACGWEQCHLHKWLFNAIVFGFSCNLMMIEQFLCSFRFSLSYPAHVSHSRACFCLADAQQPHFYFYGYGAELEIVLSVCVVAADRFLCVWRNSTLPERKREWM